MSFHFSKNPSPPSSTISKPQACWSNLNPESLLVVIMIKGRIKIMRNRSWPKAVNGYQNSAMQCATEHALSSRELSETVRLLQACSTGEQTQFVLEKPREAIRQSQDGYVHQWDPRLSTAGNRAARRLGFLLDAATKMNHWLRLTGRSELQACDRHLLVSSFTKLQQESSLLGESVGDFIKELKLP